MLLLIKYQVDDMDADKSSNRDPHSRLSRQSVIEALLEVRLASNNNPDIFVNQGRLFHGEGDRLFGGITVGQSLNAAQETVSTAFVAHSMHCTFVSPGSATAAIEYHVEHVKDGKSFSIRAVRAVQCRRTIFLAVIGFALLGARQESAGGLEHAEPIPPDVPVPHHQSDGEGDDDDPLPPQSPYINHSVGISTSAAPGNPVDVRIHQWIKARGPISARSGSRAHLAPLACMSDSYFLAALPHSHGIWDFVWPPASEVYQGRGRLALASSTAHTPIPRPHLEYYPTICRGVSSGSSSDTPVRTTARGRSHRVKMMASLDHTIFFHNQAKLRADEWLMTEVRTSWAGEGRGLVHQTIWGLDGTLVASCVQQGVVTVEGLHNGGHLSDERSSRL